jgi:glycosyltransferase involved in cell wall biosynthesis
VEPIATKILYYIDQPSSWIALSKCLIVRGWCFATDGDQLQGVRLCAGSTFLSGITGMPRPDVKAALNSAPNNNTGFEIRGFLPTGRSNVVIEAKLANGEWYRFFEETVEVRRGCFPIWLNTQVRSELMYFQMPAHMKHPPRALHTEKFTRIKKSIAHPKFSIVTPSFQQAKYLPETLKSVLEQTQITCEYVVQDGGSTDDSAEIIRVHGERKKTTSNHSDSIQIGVQLTAWESARDEGQTNAIIRGFAKTSGTPNDLMAWINSDDFYLSGALAYVAKYFADHPEVDVVYGHRILVDENSAEIGRWFLPEHNDEVLRLNDFVPQETLFWRRRIWDKVGGLDASFKFAMDWDLLLRFQAAGARIVRVPYFLACFRIHSLQKTSSAMHSVGESEIAALRERTFGRQIPAAGLEENPLLLRYLRRSAWIEFLWKVGIRAS